MTILDKCEAAAIQGSRYEAIGGLTGVEIPPDCKTKDETAILDMNDLSMFIWPETTASSEPRNLSLWRDGLELVQGIRTEDGTETDPAAIAKMDFFTERGF